jgi:hypothetical protein
MAAISRTLVEGTWLKMLRYQCTTHLSTAHSTATAAQPPLASATPPNRSHAKAGKYLQSQRLRRFLGEYPGCTTIHKPLFMHRKTYSALLTRLRQIEAKPESRTYKSKRLTAATLKPNNMYRVQLAAVGNA